MNVCSLLFLNFVQQQISRKCFCWYFVTHLPYIMSHVPCLVWLMGGQCYFS